MGDRKSPITAYGVQLNYGDLVVRCALLDNDFKYELYNSFGYERDDIDEFVKIYQIKSIDILNFLDTLEIDKYDMMRAVILNLGLRILIEDSTQKVLLYKDYIPLNDGFTRISSSKLKKNMNKLKDSLLKIKIKLEPKLFTFF